MHIKIMMLFCLLLTSNAFSQNHKAWPKKKAIDPDSLPFVTIPAMAAKEVMLYKGNSMNIGKNFGLIEFMRDSYNANDDFGKMSLAFYIELQRLESKNPVMNNNIKNKSSINLWPMALTIAKHQPYTALKILAVYGHDDQNNRFWDTSMEVDHYSPTLFSNLYKDGAIGVEYDPKLVEEAMEIGEQCQQLKSDVNLYHLCNGGYPYFRAHYYHVIASAYLTCRRTIAENNVLAAGQFMRKLGNYAHLQEVLKYKIDGFTTEIQLEYISSAAVKLAPALRDGLKRIAVGEKKFFIGLSEAQEKYQFSDEEYAGYRAILRRYEFEIRLRLAQHKMGIEFGQKVCANLKSYQDTTEQCLNCP